MRNLRILHIIFSMRTGGAENLLVDIINQMRRHSQVYLMVINSEKDKSLIDKIEVDVDTIYLDRPPGSKNPFYIMKFFYHILRIKPEIIHVHNWNLIYLLLPFKLFRRQPMILTLHDIKIKFKKTIKYFDKIICISKAVYKDLRKRCSLCNGVVIYNGINFDSILGKKQFKNKKFKICQVSRLDHLKKGQHILLKAFSLFLKKYPDSELHLYGDGPSKEYLVQLSQDLGIYDKVFFHGKVDRHKIYKELHKCSLLVQPSLYEGFGLTIIECMAAKVPVLVSDIDGPMEIIDYGQYGLYFKSGSYEDCYKKLILIKQMYDTDLQFLKDCIDRSYNYAIRKFSIRHTISEYLGLYYRLLLKKSISGL